MQSFDSIQQLKNGKKYDTANGKKISENSYVESSPITNLRERNVEDEPEVHVLTQEELNAQIRNHIGPLSSQLEELTRLIQDKTTAQHPNS